MSAGGRNQRSAATKGNMDKSDGAGGTNRGAGQSHMSVRGICIAGVLTAMTVVMTVFTRIPAAHGYFNLGDAVVLLAGVMYGGYTGAFAGAVGSALADIFTGAYIFAPISFVVKGVEGYLAGRISGGGLAGAKIKADKSAAAKLTGGKSAAAKLTGGKSAEAKLTGGKSAEARPAASRLTVALAAGAIAMVAGYFLAEASVLSLFDGAFGITAAVAELPINLIQGAASAALARVAVEGLKRTGII